MKVQRVPRVHEAIGSNTSVEILSLKNPFARVHALEDLIERLQPVGQFHHLSPQNGVLSLNIQVVLVGSIDGCEDMVVFLSELTQLGSQIIQVLLLPHP